MGEDLEGVPLEIKAMPGDDVLTVDEWREVKS